MNVCVLAKPFLTRCQIAALENVASLDGVTLRMAVVDSSVESDHLAAAGADVIDQGRRVSLNDLKLFVTVLRKRRLRALLYADEKLGWLVFGEQNQLDWLRTTRVAEVDCLSEADVESCTPNEDGAWKSLPDSVVDRVADTCDVCIRFGFGLIKGRILDAPKYGVLSAHGSDIREYRGLGPLMTFLRDDESACLTIQQLSEEIDGGKVAAIECRALPDHPTVDDVRGELYELQTEAFADAIDELSERGADAVESVELGEYYSHDLLRTNPLFVFRILLKNNARRIRSVLPDPFENRW